MNEQAAVFISQEDHLKLSALLVHSRSEVAELLEEELDRAEVLPQRDVPPDVVTMNSSIRFKDTESGAESEITLVYPQDADPANRRVSILAPVGAAVLGLRVGASIEWPVPDGRIRRLQITSVLYQPEAAGDWHL